MTQPTQNPQRPSNFTLDGSSKRDVDDNSLPPSKKPRVDGDAATDSAEQRAEEENESRRSAAQRVFDVTELLENVLLQLPEPASIMAVQRVSRHFRNAIASSPRLQTKAFLRKTTAPELVKVKCINPSLVQRATGQIHRLKPYGRTALLNAKAIPHGQSCDKMYIASPHNRKAYFQIIVRVGGLDFMVRRNVENSSGVTFKNITDAFWKAGPKDGSGEGFELLKTSLTWNTAPQLQGNTLRDVVAAEERSHESIARIGFAMVILV